MKKKVRDVWVESLMGSVVHIFKNKYRMLTHWRARSFVGLSCNTRRMPYDEAVAALRSQIFVRCQDHCELCGAFVTENGPDHKGDLHERVWRGDGGEISLENSIFVCRRCHNKAHSGRSPQFLKK